jgi:hypothetical protein
MLSPRNELAKHPCLSPPFVGATHVSPLHTHASTAILAFRRGELPFALIIHILTHEPVMLSVAEASMSFLPFVGAIHVSPLYDFHHSDAFCRGESSFALTSFCLLRGDVARATGVCQCIPYPLCIFKTLLYLFLVPSSTPMQMKKTP